MAKRVAVISDVHANWHALEAVLEEIEREQPDELWCLGDLVGYGPRPNPCCAAVERRAAICLAGNHDLGVLGEIDLEEFAGDAVAAARWTRGVLAEGSRAFLQSLRPRASATGSSSSTRARATRSGSTCSRPTSRAWRFELTESPLLLVGHSHVPLAIMLEDDVLDGGLAADGHETALGPGRRLLNPGSVGQPRDGDPRAAWLLLDFEAGTASFRRVEYDVARTQEEIRERGLPDALAQRLAHGV